MRTYRIGVLLLSLALLLASLPQPHASMKTFAALKPVADYPAAVRPADGSPMPLLSTCVDGLSFCAGEQAVALRGVNLPNLIFAGSRLNIGSLDQYKTDVELTRSWGINFAVISYDPVRAGDQRYAEQIVESVEYARSRGLYVELMQHHSTPDLLADRVTHLAIRDQADELTTNVGLRWLALLGHPGLAERLGQSVDIFGIFSEPSEITWKRWRPRAEKACLDIRARVEREAVCSISGVAWGWDIRGLENDPFRIGSVAAEVHNYQGHEFRLGRRWNWEPLAGKAPLLVGELGYTDSPEYLERLFSDLRKYQLSWAAWPGPPILWAQGDGLNKVLQSELARETSPVW